MQLYSDDSQYSHRIRFLLGIKAVSFDLVPIKKRQKSQALLDINPYKTLPTLYSKDITLYDRMSMMEYVEERFPYPKLLPVTPLERAKLRQLMYRIQTDLCAPADVIVAGSARRRETARQVLRDNLSSMLPLYSEHKWCGSDEMSLVDVCLAPLLWRLTFFKVQVRQTRRSMPFVQYMERLFGNRGFLASLSASEREMR